MKLHLPITLRKALMSLFTVLRPAGVAVALAASSAVAATIEGDNAVIGKDATYTDGLTMQGENSNKIGVTIEVSGGVIDLGFIQLPIYVEGVNVLGKTSTTVEVGGNATMTTTSGVNAMVGNAWELKDMVNAKLDTLSDTFSKFSIDVEDLKLTEAAYPTLNATGEVTMNGPANVLMMGSTVTGTSVTLKNEGKQPTSLLSVVDVALGEMGGMIRVADLILDDDQKTMLESYQGNFNLVQGSTVEVARTRGAYPCTPV